MVVDREGNSNWSYHVWRSRKPSSSFFNRISEHNQEKISENDFAVRTFKTTLTFLWSFDAKYLSWQVRGAASQTKRLRCHSFLCVQNILENYMKKILFFGHFLKKKTLLMTWCVGFGGGFYNLFPFFCVWKKIAQFFSGSILIIGCPILDMGNYSSLVIKRFLFGRSFEMHRFFSFLEKWQNALRIKVLGVSNWSSSYICEK